jgi:hypothetical protein
MAEVTTETRTLIELGDICGIDLACQRCEAKIICPIEKNGERVTEECPNCKEKWFTFKQGQGRMVSVSLDQIQYLMKVVTELSNPGNDLLAKLRVHVKVETANPASAVK